MKDKDYNDIVKRTKKALLKAKLYYLKANAQTVGCGQWFSTTRAQKRIKGIKA